MSKDFNFKCDKCSKKVAAIFNGEHWLPPETWAEIVSSKTVEVIGHICGLCNPVKPKSNEKKKSK
jgi:hypothetical protein